MAEDLSARRLELLVDQYVETRSRRYDFVSTTAAQRAIGQVMPSLAIVPRALDELVARRAIAVGLSVHFDRDS